MFGTKVRPVVIVLATVVAMVVAPAVSVAYEMTCANNYDAYLCNDGTIITCGGIFGPQFDCPNEPELGATACQDYGGLRAVGPANGQVGNAQIIADYKGQQPVPPYTGNGQINSTVVTTLNVTCATGRTFACVEPRMSCGPTDLRGRCGATGVRSISTQFAFTIFGIPATPAPR